MTITLAIYTDDLTKKSIKNIPRKHPRLQKTLPHLTEINLKEYFVKKKSYKIGRYQNSIHLHTLKKRKTY